MLAITIYSIIHVMAYYLRKEREPDRFANLLDHMIPRLALHGSSSGAAHMNVSRHEEVLTVHKSTYMYVSSGTNYIIIPGTHI